MSLIKYFNLEEEIRKNMAIFVFIDTFKCNEDDVIKSYINKGYRRDDIIICYVYNFWLDHERYRDGLGYYVNGILHPYRFCS